ncbi:hypothetical protein [Methylobrevis pamukkalensis]|uniref:hypothetical protein n=1 Tax=Methylobrevis pamukkalensis TaxID=1439726 RepID=UPI000845F3BD|nr:hypothetical protein [Methylobrevis pamukkalensis]
MLDGAAIRLDADGGAAADGAALDVTLALSDLSRLAPTLAGSTNAGLRIEGPLTAPRVSGRVTTENVRLEGRVLSPFTADLDVTPTAAGAVSGTVRLAGALDGAPIDVDAEIARGEDGALSLKILRGALASATLSGALQAAADGALAGNLDVNVRDLGPLAALGGVNGASGTLTATVSLGAEGGVPVANVNVTSPNLSAAGAAVGTLALTAKIREPMTAPALDARLTLARASTSGVAARDVTLTTTGPLTALGFTLKGVVNEIALDGRGEVALAETTRLRLDALSARRGRAVATLPRPATVTVDGGRTTVDLAVDAAGGSLTVAGTVAERLDLRVATRNVGFQILDLVAPDAGVAGTLTATATVSGTPAKPEVTYDASASGITLAAARDLPALALAVNGRFDAPAPA